MLSFILRFDSFFFSSYFTFVYLLVFALPLRCVLDHVNIISLLLQAMCVYIVYICVYTELGVSSSFSTLRWHSPYLIIRKQTRYIYIYTSTCPAACVCQKLLFWLTPQAAKSGQRLFPLDLKQHDLLHYHGLQSH